MLNKIIRYVLPFTLLIGSLLIAFGLSNIDGATIITERSINYQGYTWTYKFIDLKLYLQNLEEALKTSNFEAMLPNLPNQLHAAPSATDIIGWVKFLGYNVFPYLLNWIIYTLDWVLLVPLKILVYPINLILIILGINGSNEAYITVIRSIYNFNIPYIPYF